MFVYLNDIPRFPQRLWKLLESARDSRSAGFWDQKRRYLGPIKKGPLIKGSQTHSFLAKAGRKVQSTEARRGWRDFFPRAEYEGTGVKLFVLIV